MQKCSDPGSPVFALNPDLHGNVKGCVVNTLMFKFRLLDAVADGSVK